MSRLPPRKLWRLNGSHRDHGQLGYALKDKNEPEWESAIKELSKAIELRGTWTKQGFRSYEFNRAVCRIHIDPENRGEILADLRVAATSQRSGGAGTWIKEDEDIQQWLRNHNLSELDLRHE